MRRTERSRGPTGQQLDDPFPAARFRETDSMVAIAESFRAHWEAADEFRRIADSERSAEWPLWLSGAEPPAHLPSAMHGAFASPWMPPGSVPLPQPRV